MPSWYSEARIVEIMEGIQAQEEMHLRSGLQTLKHSDGRQRTNTVDLHQLIFQSRASGLRSQRLLVPNEIDVAEPE
jgi:hypothetical protein